MTLATKKPTALVGIPCLPLPINLICLPGDNTAGLLGEDARGVAMAEERRLLRVVACVAEEDEVDEVDEEVVGEADACPAMNAVSGKCRNSGGTAAHG